MYVLWYIRSGVIKLLEPAESPPVATTPPSVRTTDHMPRVFVHGDLEARNSNSLHCRSSRRQAGCLGRRQWWPQRGFAESGEASRWHASGWLYTTISHKTCREYFQTGPGREGRQFGRAMATSFRENIHFRECPSQGQPCMYYVIVFRFPWYTYTWIH